MAKQTFTTGQVLTAAQMTDLQQTAMTGGAASTKTVSYVLVAADAGTRVAMNAAGSTTITVNTGLFSAGDTVSIQNIGAGVCTVTAGTATVNTSGSLVLAQYQGGILYFTSASAALFFQFATPASGDIEGVTAGTGISGGGTSGTVTITNSMATEITAKGDLIVGTGNASFDNLPVGTNGHTLVADSAETTGLKWAAASSGDANWSLKNSGGTTLSGAATITISGISGVDKIMVLVADIKGTGAQNAYFVRYNGDTGNNYTYYGGIVEAASSWSSGNVYNRTTATDSAALLGGASTNANALFSGFHLVSGCNASGVKVFNSGGASSNGGGSSNGLYLLGGFWNGSGTVTSVSIWNNQANFTSGTVYVYTSA
jgi:hypothetical protein